MRRALPFLVAVALVAAVVVPYVALGGGSFEPTPVADPCSPRAYPEADGLAETIERIALTAVDGVACELGVSREDLVLGLRIERSEAEDAIHEGLVEAVDKAEQDGTLPGLVAPLVRKAAESVPPWLLLETLERFGDLLPG